MRFPAIDAVLWALLLLSSLTWVNGFKVCSEDRGGGVCPDNNECCPTGVPGISSCITIKQPKKAKNNTTNIKNVDAFSSTAICCDSGITGCGPGYQCAPTSKKLSTQSNKAPFCARTSKGPGSKKRGQPRHLPRYQLCSLPEYSLKSVHKLTVKKGAPKLAYLSTLGSIEMVKQPIKQVVITIHGSLRDVEDYLCCTSASIPVRFASTTMVIAPHFMAPEDIKAHGNHNGTTPKVSSSYLRWNETDPIPHTWRYGADALYTDTSSFQALDRLVETVIRHFKSSLARVIVTGHSAGGQFTHRWALTSQSSAWDSGIPIRVVAANPRSFAYLDDRRYFWRNHQLSGSNKTVSKLIFEKPTPDQIESCKTYNTWEWGLETEGARLKAPYVERAGGPEAMRKRYAKRQVVYLAGEKDEAQVKSECEDDLFQGQTRKERSRRFFASLSEIYKDEKQPLHRRLIAKGIHHDHCLIYQSDAGQAAFFEPIHPKGSLESSF